MLNIIYTISDIDSKKNLLIITSILTTQSIIYQLSIGYNFETDGGLCEHGPLTVNILILCVSCFQLEEIVKIANGERSLVRITGLEGHLTRLKQRVDVFFN